MIATLRGVIHRLDPGAAIVDVGGVGYLVAVPLDVWNDLAEGATRALWTSTYVREDRLELYGFADRAGLRLFEALIALQGIGPRLGLELCGVPRGLLLQAVQNDDPRTLMSVKGIGKKTAEKLLLELRSLAERHQDMFGAQDGRVSAGGALDQDAVAALRNLGYDTGTILRALNDVPEACETTEERVAAALRAL